MKPTTRNFQGFFLAAAITAGAWFALWPRTDLPSPPLSPVPGPPPVQVRWSKERIAALVDAVEKAGQDEARLNACTDLLQIPAEDARELLETATLKDGRRLSLVAKVLLIRWASENGEAATVWAWQRFRSEGIWDQAFRETGPAWAAHDPAGLGRWALAAAGRVKPGDGEPKLADAASMDEPFVDFGMLTDIAGWLVTEDPRLAYQLVKKRGGFSTKDMEMPSAISSAAGIREALQAFEGVKITNPTRLAGDQLPVYYLLQRWHEIDPGDYNRSPHAGSIETRTAEKSAALLEQWTSLPDEEKAAAADRSLADQIPTARAWQIPAIAEAWAASDPTAAVRWLDSLPSEDIVSVNAAKVSVLARHDPSAALDHVDRLPGDQRGRALVAAFDAWTRANPGQPANHEGWPDDRIQAWEDLEALLPVNGK